LGREERKTMLTRIYIDTNIFLHYQPFDQIDWSEIAKSDNVLLIIPPVTIRELNHYKDSQSRLHIKKRSSEAIRKLTQLFDTGITAKLRDNVSIKFEDRDPVIDYSTTYLNPNIQDDQLIASMLMDRKESPECNLVLITSDLGLALSTKAGRHGITTIRMPENLRIVDEPDQNENKIKQLEQQVRELNIRVPSLLLSFEDGSQHSTFNISKPIILNQSDIDQKKTELTGKYPKRESIGSLKKSTSSELNLSEDKLLTIQFALGSITQEEIDRYNNEVESYIASYPDYLVIKLNYENMNRRTIRLNILLANEGTMPAEDIDVYMHFPDGFRLLEENDLPPSPRPPAQPTPPMTEFEKLSASMRNLSVYNFPSLGSSYGHTTTSAPPPNVSSPHIKRTNSYDVQFHIQRVKHNMQVNFDTLFIIFNSYEESSSFSIEYQILAANLPKKVTGNLHVVIEKEPC
jgi:hypothetical protein